MPANPNRDYIKHLTQFCDLVAEEGIVSHFEIEAMEIALRECTKGAGFYSDMGFELLNKIEKRAPAKYKLLRSIAESHNFFREV